MAQIAFILDSDFEDSEFRVPYDRVREAGHTPVVIGQQAGKELAGKKGQVKVRAEKGIDEVRAADFDGLVIPGGYSPDHLRTNIKVVAFVRELHDAQKPVAAVCHAGSLLVEADLAEGHTVTSWPSIKTDLINAGARWVDREVVEDGNLITSRNPGDLEAFSKALLRQLAEGPAQRLGTPARAELPPAPH